MACFHSDVKIFLVQSWCAEKDELHERQTFSRSSCEFSEGQIWEIGKLVILEAGKTMFQMYIKVQKDTNARPSQGFTNSGKVNLWRFWRVLERKKNNSFQGELSSLVQTRNCTANRR